MVSPTLGARHRRRRGWGLPLLLAAVLLSLAPLTVQADAPVATEHEVKAAYLYIFGKFVRWPEHAFSDSDQPFVIGVLGDDPFGGVLDLTVRDRLVQNRKLIVKRFASAK